MKIFRKKGSNKLQKIAIIFQNASLGGGTRFFQSLILSIIKNYPDLQIGLFLQKKTLGIDNLKSKLKRNKNIKMVYLKSNLKSFNFTLSNRIINKLNSYDVIYLPWPYLIEPFNIKKPLLATFHDCNFMHDFNNYEKTILPLLKKQFAQWINNSYAQIVSTNFIKSEIQKFFNPPKPKIVYLAPFAHKSHNTHKNTIIKNNLPKEYILYPANTSYHKNHYKLFDAFGILKKIKLNIPLVLAGMHTDSILKTYQDDKFPLSEIFQPFVDSLKKNNLKPNEDVFFLGFVSDSEIYELIKNARLTISTSLYEAGSGPALDAWKLHTPVAFSNISSHLDQLGFLKTKAWTFDPKDSTNIADTIKKAAIDEKETSIKMAQESKKAMDNYNWDMVAEQYYQIFSEAFEKNKNK